MKLQRSRSTATVPDYLKAFLPNPAALNLPESVSSVIMSWDVVLAVPVSETPQLITVENNHRALEACTTGLRKWLLQNKNTEGQKYVLELYRTLVKIRNQTADLLKNVRAQQAAWQKKENTPAQTST